MMRRRETIGSTARLFSFEFIRCQDADPIPEVANDVTRTIETDLENIDEVNVT